jgi:hypothetical protein
LRRVYVHSDHDRVTSEDSITIPAHLVKYLRCGIINHLKWCIAVLDTRLSDDIDERALQLAFAELSDTWQLFDTAGATTISSTEDLVLPAKRWDLRIVRALEAQYASERTRIEDARAQGFPIPARDVPELHRFVVDLRRRLGLPARPLQERRSRGQRNRGDR